MILILVQVLKSFKKQGSASYLVLINEMFTKNRGVHLRVYKIADIKVLLNCSKRTMKNAEPYLIPNYDGEYDFEIKQDTKAAFNDLYEKWRTEENREVADFIYEARQFHTKILDYNAMMLHASAVVADDVAYLFSAPSGTGKSTHTKLWLEMLGERAYILNDDKPVIRILEDGIYAYGTPWCGSSDIGVNRKAKLKAICFIERAESNWIKRMELSDGMPLILNMFYATIRQLDRYSCMTPITPDNASKYLDLIIKIIEEIPVYQLGCTPDISAARLAYETMNRG